MWQDSDYLEAYATEHTLRIQSLVIGEFNMNQYDNIEKIGNYRYRPNGTDGKFITVLSSYDPFDEGDFYTDADISYTEYADTKDVEGNILRFTEQGYDRELYYSLADCFLPFRPRSGINKSIILPNRYIDNIRSAERPRYYMPAKNDPFKYWISYRKGDINSDGTVDQVEKGLSDTTETNGIGYYITDACPFVVYESMMPINRIVVKAQTNVGTLNLGQIRSLATGELIDDPLAGEANATVPRRWDIQYLTENNQWVNAISFDENSVRRDGTSIWRTDGYVEVYYGIKPPERYEEDFTFIGYINSTLLPNEGLRTGIAYVVDSEDNDPGTLYVFDSDSDDWVTFPVEYGFNLLQDDLTKDRGIVKNIVNPLKYNVGAEKVYKEFIRIKGLRIVVHTMNRPECPFELIELSPRLTVDLSDYTQSFNITKTLANVGTGLPVGSLTASNGNIEFHNHQNAFSPQNVFDTDTDEGSIIASLLFPNTKFDIFETVLDINGYDKFIPIKTFYAEIFPRPTGTDSSVNVSLRDAYFKFETVNAPQVLLQQATLTMCVANLLDYIGFSNYSFKNIDGTNDPVIPYFFVEPNVSVAEILNRLEG